MIKSVPWRKFMRVRAEIDMEHPLKQDLVIETKGGESIKLIFKFEKLGKLCFICGLLGHTNNFCNKKFMASEKHGRRKWGPYLRAKSSSAGGSKPTSKWLVGGRSSNFSGQREEVATFNENKGNLSNSADGHENSNHKIYGRIKLTSDSRTRKLQIYKYTECQ